MIQPCPDLLYAESVPGLYDFTERLRIRVKSISQNMIFTLIVLAGELYAREELRVLFSQDILDDQTALEIAPLTCSRISWGESVPSETVVCKCRSIFSGYFIVFPISCQCCSRLPFHYNGRRLSCELLPILTAIT